MTVIKKVITLDNLDLNHFEVDEAARKIRLKNATTGGSGTTTVNGNVVTDLTIDNLARQITWKQGGVNRSYDMSSLLADIKVTGATLNSGILTLRQEGGANIDVDLGKLAEVAYSNTGNVKFSGTGTTQDPLVANVDIPVYTGTGGVKVEGTQVSLDTTVFTATLTDAFGQTTLGKMLPPEG